MGASMLPVRHLDEGGRLQDDCWQILNSDGVVVFGVGLHATEAPDGSIRAQLELRSPDQSSTVCTASPWVDIARYAVGRSRIVVTLDPESRDTAALRFSIDIPNTTRDFGGNTGNDETSPACVVAEGKAICPMRERRGYTQCSSRRVCQMAANWRSGQLANDWRRAIMESLSALPHDRENPDSQ